MKKVINEVKRMQELAGLITESAWGNVSQENIYDNLKETDHSELVNKLMETADSNPSLTLIDFLKTFDVTDNEDEEDEDFLNEDDSLKNVKKIITSVFRKNGIKGLTLTPTSVKGFSRSSDNKGYKHEYAGLVTMKGLSEEEVNSIFNELEAAGVKLSNKRQSSFQYDY
jgi:hypothetical protein